MDRKAQRSNSHNSDRLRLECLAHGLSKPRTILLTLAALTFIPIQPVQIEEELSLLSATQAYNHALRLKAERKYEKAVDELRRIIQQRPSFDRAYGKIISFYQEMRQPEMARAYFEELEAKKPLSPYLLYGQALLYRHRNELETAESHIAKCLQLAPGFAPAYKELVEIAKERGHLQEVSSSLSNLIKVNPANAAAQYGLGYALQQQNESTKALEHLNRAVELDQSLLEAYLARHSVYDALDKFPEALAELKMILVRAETSDDSEWRSRVLKPIGSIYSDLGDYDEASRYLKAGLEIAQEIANPTEEQSCLAHLATVYFYQGSYREALEVCERALKISREVGDRFSEGRIIGLVGKLNSQSGNYPQAIDAHLQAAAIAREVEDRPSEASQLGNISSVYILLGDYGRALENLQTAFKLVGETRNPWLWQVLGSVYWKLDKPSEALAAYRHALQDARELGVKSEEVITLTYLGEVYSKVGNSHQALQGYEQALKIAGEIGALTLEGGVLNELGKLHLELKNYAQAEKYYEKALELGSEIVMPEVIWPAHAGLAEVYQKRDQLIQALDHRRLAIETIERVRGKLDIADEKAGFLQDKIEVYRNHIALLTRLHEKDPARDYDAMAFHYAERALARSFLDLMAESKARVEQGVDTTLLERQREIQSRITQTQSQLVRLYSAKSQDPQKLKVLESSSAAADEDHHALQREIRRRHPRYADLHYPEPIQLKEAQHLLDEKSVLLEYSLGEDASVLFAISQKDTLLARLPPAAVLADRVKKLRQGIAQPSRANWSNYLTQARRLHQELIQPAERLLEGKQALIIVPDGILHYLPFEVLFRQQTTERSGPRDLAYLVNDYALSYAPSASVLAHLARDVEEGQEPQKMFLAFADPFYGGSGVSEASSAGLLVRSAFGEGSTLKLSRLEQSRQEVEGIAKLYSREEVTLFLGKEANEENVKTRDLLSQYRIIHFATHGLLNEDRPQFSGLVLSLPELQRENAREDKETVRAAATPGKLNRSLPPAEKSPSPEDGLLQVYEIFDLKLKADLVVLSACETGLGKEVKGEGLIGLTRAFMYAGTPSVAVSLWKVADRSTAELMIRFYQHLRDTQTSKAEALRRAQLEMIRDGTFAHPYFWAPFVLIGKS